MYLKSNIGIIELFVDRFWTVLSLNLIKSINKYVLKKSGRLEKLIISHNIAFAVNYFYMY